MAADVPVGEGMTSHTITIAALRARSFGLNCALAISAMVVSLLVLNHYSYSFTFARITHLGISGFLIIIIILTIFTSILESLCRILERYFKGNWKGSGRLAKYLLRRALQRQIERYDRLRDRVIEADDILRKKAEIAAGEGPVIERRLLWSDFARLREFPARERIGPTRLGNALVAAMDRLGDRYAIAAPIVTPRLMNTLTRRESRNLEAAMLRVDSNTRLCATTIGFSVLFLIAGGLAGSVQIGFFWLGAFISLILARLVYDASVQAATEYGVWLEVAFDLNRIKLLKRLNIAPPQTVDQEKHLYMIVSDMLSGASVHGVEFMYQQKIGKGVRVVKNVMTGDSYYTEQAMAVGRKAKARAKNVNYIKKEEAISSLDLGRLADELMKLRSKLHENPESPQRDSAIGAIADAEAAARG